MSILDKIVKLFSARPKEDEVQSVVSFFDRVKKRVEKTVSRSKVQNAYNAGRVDAYASVIEYIKSEIVDAKLRGEKKDGD